MPGIDGFTVLMLHMGGTDESTSFLDSSASAHVVTAQDNSQIDTAEFKFEGASALFDAVNDRLDIPDSPDFDFGSGEFTIDFWAKFNALGSTSHMCSQWEGGNNKSFSIRKINSDVFDMEYRTIGGSNFTSTSSFTLSDTDWHHYTIVRDGNTLRFFVDGIAEGTDDWTGVTLNNASRVLHVSSFSDGSQAMDGWIDELRISKGIARWTSNFSVPTEEYTVNASLSGYDFRKKLIVDNNKIDSTQTDFPVLVKLNSSNFDFTKAKNDGADIRFTTSDGTTLLKFERERHDHIAELAEYHVKVPNILSLTDTDIFVYYGNASATDGEDAQNVWDSNFRAVYHMQNKTSTTVEDSTSNGDDGTKDSSTEPNEVNSDIFKAQDFDGTDEITTPNLGFSGDTDITISARIKPDAGETNTRMSIFGFGNLSNDQSCSFRTGNNGGGAQDGSILFFFFANDLEVTGLSNYYNTTVNVDAVYDSSGSQRFIYINGVEVGNDAPSNPNFQDTNYSIGAFTEDMKGLIDEVRISNIPRDAAFIKAQSNSNNDTLLTFGTEETLAVFIDIDTDIRIKHTEAIEDIDTDIRILKESINDLDTDIRISFTQVAEDINTDIRITDFQSPLGIGKLVDIDPDVRVAIQPLEDLNTDIRTKIISIFVDTNTDIRAKHTEVLFDIDTDIRTGVSVFEDVSSDIRAFFFIPTSNVVVQDLTVREGLFLTISTINIDMQVFGAVRMQFRNENEVDFSTYETYNDTKLHNLSVGDGTKRIFIRFQDILGSITDGNDFLEVEVGTTTPDGVVIEAYEDETAAIAIPAATFQNDVNPFFQWSVPIFGAIPYNGFSYALDADPDDIIDIPTPNIVTDGILVTKKTPFPEMTIETSDGTYYFNSDFKEYDSQELALADGGVLDRIDLIWISANNESLNITTGVESVTPVAPEGPTDAIELANALVPAGTTLIANVTITDVREDKVKIIQFLTQNLTPGQHTLKVRSFVANGLVSLDSTFDIYIADPSPEMGEIEVYTDGTKTIQLTDGNYQTVDADPFLEWAAAPAEPGPIEYHYTTDGSEPTLASPFTTGTTLNLGPFAEGVTEIKVKPFDTGASNSGHTQEFTFIFGSSTFTEDTAVIGGGTTLKQSLKEIQVKSIKWNFDSARNCIIFQPVLFDETLPFSVGQTISVVHGSTNATLFTGRIIVIERMMDAGQEGVMYNCVGPRGKLNECFAVLDDPELGNTAQITFDDVPIATAVSTIAGIVPDVIRRIDSFPTGANVSEEFIAQTVSQVLSRLYERTKFGWYMTPDSTLRSVDSTAVNSGEAKFGVFGTTVSSLSPQFNVMSSNLQFDVSRRYKTAIIEGSRIRTLERLSASCTSGGISEERLIAQADRTDGTNFKNFKVNTDKKVVKIIETFVTYGRIKQFTLFPLGSRAGISTFKIFLTRWEICKSNKITTYSRGPLYSTLSVVPIFNITRVKNQAEVDAVNTEVRSDPLGGSSFPVSQKLVGFGPVISSISSESQGSLGANNTIKFGREMYSFWPTGTSLNTGSVITATPGRDNTSGIAPNYYWKESPKKRCASVSADVLLEGESLRATVNVSGTADTNKILRLVKPEFKFDEDPENPIDDTTRMIEFATDTLQKFKDIKINGTIVLDTIDLFWDLDKTVNLINTQQGSWTTLNIKVVGINYNFDENTTTLEITSEFLK